MSADSPPAIPRASAVGEALLRDVAELLPMRRCITGTGLRETLDWIGARVPITRSEVPTGTTVGDWTIPPEWAVRDAYVELPDGSRLVDWADSALHLVQYSTAVDATMTLGELRPRLHTLPERPSATPYRTSYYNPSWGFCLSHECLTTALETWGDAAVVRVVIDAEHADGALSYGECLIPGESEAEILLSAHVCHPHLANDNAAATAILTAVGRKLLDEPRRHFSVRLLFAPGTLGAVAWLARSPEASARVRGGLVLATLGDAGSLVYKQTRRGTLDASSLPKGTVTDRAAALALRDLGVPYETRPFAPVGYDERQFDAAGLDLNVGRLSRTPWGEYPEYHTSDDDIDLLSADALAESFDAVLAFLDTFDASVAHRVVEAVAVGEPMLGRHGLYAHPDGTPTTPDEHRSLLWALNVADGEHTLLDAAEASGLPVAILAAAAGRALAAGVLARDSYAPISSPEWSSRTEVRDLQQIGDDDAGDLSGIEHGGRLDQTHSTFARSLAHQRRAHEQIPGGAHTYAKGDDQMPEPMPVVIARGEGCRVWDLDGNEYVEYGMGLRAVTLGHAEPRVLAAATEWLGRGANFSRPAEIELLAAEAFLRAVPGQDMVKFTKDGSSATTAAVKLARAATGRDVVAFCADHPFLSQDDWFIASTPLAAGIPDATRALTRHFSYGDADALRATLADGQVACVVMEAVRDESDPTAYLREVQQICADAGTLFVLDEMITGLRWHPGGAQTLYGLRPDLTTFGKALGNGFAVSALAGRRDLMELGGLRDTGADRVFLLSATHGAETHALAAAVEVLRIYETEDVIGTMHARGAELRRGVADVVTHHGLDGFVGTAGRDCNLTYFTCDAQGVASQAYRTLFLQEMTRRGVLGPSFVISAAHDAAAIATTLRALDGTLAVYKQAIEARTTDGFLVGRPVQPVFRRRAGTVWSSESATDPAGDGIGTLSASDPTVRTAHAPKS